MRKIYMLIFVLVCGFGYLQAQGWWVYDASDLPENSGFSTSSVKSGDNEDIQIIADPYIDGNSYLSYIQPDPNAPDGTKYTKAYKLNFDAGTGKNGYTVIARLKGLGVDTLNAITELQILSSTFNTRQYLQINPATDELKFAQDDKVTGAAGVDTDEWHIYRFTFGADSVSNVYVDEGASTVLTTKNTGAKSDNYFRFGDGGSAQTGGCVDWIIIDTTGAYAPGSGAIIPDSLSKDFGPQEGYKPGAGYNLAFVTINSVKDTNGFYTDSMFVVDLADAGFNVTVVEYNDGSPKPSNDFASTLLANDVVVLSRVISSARLTDQKTYWAKLQVPIVSMSSYGARSNKMGWLPSSSCKYGTDYGIQEAKVMIPEDTIFNSVTVPADSIIDFNSDYLSFLTVETQKMDLLPSSSKVLLSMVNGVVAKDYQKSVIPAGDVNFAAYSDNDSLVAPLMVRWAPLDSMFAESAGAAARPFHYRTFLAGGDDHQSAILANNDTAKLYGMYMYSDIVDTLLVNECAYLAGLDGPAISDDYTLDTLTVSIGSLDPEFTPDGTSYTVVVPEGTTSIDITAIVNDTAASLEGGGTYALDGSDTAIVVKVTSEAGTPSIINILVKEAKVVTDNIIPPGLNTIVDYLKNSDYEEYILVNGEVYESLDPIVIDRKITLKAQDTVTLPALDNLPVIKNTYGVAHMIKLENGADFTLFGVDVDGNGSASVAISMLSDSSHNVIDGLQLIRCRIHDVAGDLILATKSDSTILKSFVARNTFAYNSKAHGLYIKDLYAEEGVDNSPYIFENLTFWHLGQQLVWAQNWPIGAKQKYVLDHNTGYDLSYVGDKELLGCSNGGGQYDITLTNSILSEQPVSELQPSLMFTTVNDNGGDNIFSIDKNVLYNVNVIKEREGSGTIEYGDVLTNDPEFANAANGDFTIGNEAYLTAAIDGGVVGATYWHPDFVDDYADYSPQVGVEKHRSELPVNVYPMPFGSAVNFDVYLENSDVVTLSIIDVTGRIVKSETIELALGANSIAINTSDVEVGTYFFTLISSEGYTTGSLVKAE